MHYVLVLLTASLSWTAPAFAQQTPPAPSAAASPPALAFKHKGESQAQFEERERRCLATALYFEARDGPVRREIGVGQVILNRVRTQGFPQTICGVVYQGQEAPGCQFPFACDGRSDTIKDDDQWALAQSLARQITAGQVWLPELGYALSLETALAIGTSSGGHWADCRSSDLEKRLAACNAFIAESKDSSPDLMRAYNSRGEAYYYKGDYDRAIADYDQVIRRGPDYAIAYTARGNAYDKKGAHDLAIADYEEASRLTAYGNRGTASPPSPEPPKGETVVATPEPPKTETVVVTGTGFVINDRGDVVTNNHVVEGCSQIKFGLNGQGIVQGRLVASDGTNDLAVANFLLPRTRVASFSGTVKNRPGDDLVVFGYPLLGLLSSSGNLTRGSLTAMAGMEDDVRYMQISAPIQPGNSGGPVLDMGGEVIGVVTYKLNALETMKANGDIPQNVNFALKASILRLFLDSHSIPYTVSDHSVSSSLFGSPSLGPAEVGDLSEQFTGIVVCIK